VKTTWHRQSIVYISTVKCTAAPGRCFTAWYVYRMIYDISWMPSQLVLSIHNWLSDTILEPCSYNNNYYYCNQLSVAKVHLLFTIHWYPVKIMFQSIRWHYTGLCLNRYTSFDVIKTWASSVYCYYTFLFKTVHLLWRHCRREQTLFIVSFQVYISSDVMLGFSRIYFLLLYTIYRSTCMLALTSLKAWAGSIYFIVIKQVYC